MTKMKSDMTIKAPFESWNKVVCDQGQSLAWLGFDHRHYEHWFGVEQTDSLCGTCWKRSSCPREFNFPPEHLVPNFSEQSAVDMGLLTIGRFGLSVKSFGAAGKEAKFKCFERTFSISKHLRH